MTQACVVTLDPVNTRIDTPVDRLFLAVIETPEGEAVEMPEDDSVEPLGSEIDLGEIMIESLSLNIPAYPRKDGVELGQSVTSPNRARPP